MKSEWKNVALSKIATFTTGKLNSNAAVDNGKYPFFTCSPETLRINNYAFEQEAILLAGNNAEGNFNIKYYNGRFNAYQRTYVFSARDNCNLRFLYYSLKLCLDNFKHISQGTATKFLTAKILNSFEIMLPNLETQKSIATILSSIDDKIAINTAINENLLQQALCIYASLIEDKPKNGCIGDYCALKSGFAFKSKWWQDSGVPVVKIGSINQDYLSLADCSYVSEDKVALAKDFIVSGGDLLIAMTGATIGKFTMVPKATKTILVNQRVGKFFLGDNPINRVPFIYSTLKQPDIITDIINRGQGSAQPNISASDILSIPCVIPQQTEINVFNEQTTPMFELIINNQYENQRLAVLLDTLLPKLMNGEIDVSEVKI